MNENKFNFKLSSREILVLINALEEFVELHASDKNRLSQLSGGMSLEDIRQLQSTLNIIYEENKQWF